MSPRLQRWQSSHLLAYVVPLTLFLLVQPVAGLLQLESNDAPWWRLHPEHWVYPLQTLLGAIALVFWWPRYQFRPFRSPLLAVALGLAGIAVWIAPAALGWQERTEGFDPTVFEDNPALFVFVLIVRFLRLVLIVPFLEEIFWRGFLMRYLTDPDRDFWTIPLGTFTWPSVLITTVAVTFIHSRPDWPAAAIWGTLVALLYLRSRSLSACVLMHAVANLVLGIYIVATKSWGLW